MSSEMADRPGFGPRAHRAPRRLPGLVVSLTLAVVVAASTLAAPSTAQSATGRTDGSIARGGNRPVIAVRIDVTGRGSGVSADRPSSSRPCAYYTHPGGVGNLPYLIPGELYRRVCRAYNGAPATDVIRPAVQSPSAMLPEPMERARENLELRIQPPRTSPASRALVGVPTWFWLPNPAQPLSETAELGTAPDIITATISAIPTSIEIEPGDGSTLTCDVAAPSREGSQISGAAPCTHVFERATKFQPDRSQPRYRVTWSLRWDTNRQRADGSFPGGALPDGSSTGAFPLEVVEVQAVNSGPD